MYGISSLILHQNVRYQRLETARTTDAEHALASAAKATYIHGDTILLPTCEAESNASMVITRQMQTYIDDGIAKGLAAAIKARSLGLTTTGSFLSFVHHDNKLHSSDDCKYLKSQGFTKTLNREMFSIKKAGTTKNGEVSGERGFKRNSK